VIIKTTDIKKFLETSGGGCQDAVCLAGLALSQREEASLHSSAGTQDASILPPWDREVDWCKEYFLKNNYAVARPPLKTRAETAKIIDKWIFTSILFLVYECGRVPYGQRGGRSLEGKPQDAQKQMASGIFRKGVHYFSPKGLRPRFKWSAVQAWLEEKDQRRQEEEDLIPMARGYFLGKPRAR